MARRVDIDALLGKPERRKRRVMADGSKIHKDNAYISTIAGVSVPWLADAFDMTPRKVRTRLKGLEPKDLRRDIELYDFKEAVSRLVSLTPELLATIEPKDLPPKAQKAFFDAQLQRIKYQEKAEQLWHTEDVIRVFGEAFKQIKTTTQLWVDTLDNVEELSPRQVKALERAVDGLLDEMHKTMTGLTERNKTLNAYGYDVIDLGLDEV